MSLFIRIVCRSPVRSSRAALTEIVADGDFFDEPVEFVPSDRAELERPDWPELRVIYSSSRRPVIFHANYRDPIVTTEVDEVLELLAKKGPFPEVERLLREVVQVFAIEINPDGLLDEVWQMLDAVEAHVASELDGLIYVPDEGFYDKGLKKVVNLGPETEP